MGTLQGFLDFRRKDYEYKSIEERIKNYEEYLIMQNETEMRKQAARCMGCETPYCYALGCPILNRIPEWNDLVFRKDLKGAYESLIETNCFPEFTGRICPALCESACSLSINLEPVTIKQIELYIINKAYELGFVKPILPKERKNKKVAIIGSGPAGLSAAYWLNKKGYQVYIFEKSDEIGGLMRYGIPNFKLPKWVIDRRVNLMEKEGIQFETNVTIGEDLSVDYLKNKFDAILLCMGAGVPRDLSIPGRNIDGIHFALTYLAQSTQFALEKKKESEIINAKGKNVLIIGGGDTGCDCVGTANRQGAKNVTQIDIIPKPNEWTKNYNPEWPDYPNILRTSPSHMEGCIRDFSINTKEFITKNNKVVGAHCIRVEWAKDSNNNSVMREIPGSDFVIDADLVILSMGFLHVEHSEWLEKMGIQYNERGNIAISSNYYTNINGIFSAGDATTGASLVCKGINHGKQAAICIDEFLQ